MKKFLAIMLLLAFVFSFASCAVNEEIVQKKNRIDIMIENMENEIDAMRMEILSSNKNKEEQEKLIEEKAAEIKKSYGFEPVENVKSGTEVSTPRSSSADIVFSGESLEYNSNEGLYYYSCNWNFSRWDTYCDIEDFVAIRMTNINDYYVYSTFAKTFDELGRQTGYVDNLGNHTPTTTSCVTKQYESAAGVIFNVIDMYQVTQDRYFTDQGRVTMCFAKKSSVSGTPVNKIITDFNHNYKEAHGDPTAQVSSVGLDGANFTLSVNYSLVNRYWQRSSGGKIMGS